MVSVVYSWQTGAAGFGDAQFMPPGAAASSSRQAQVLALRRRGRHAARPRRVGCYCFAPSAAAGCAVLASEQTLPPHVQALKFGDRLERVSAFRQLQAISNTLRTISGGKFATLADFKLPAGVRTRPVLPGECRRVSERGERFVAEVVDVQTGVVVELLPEVAVPPPLVTAGSVLP